MRMPDGWETMNLYIDTCQRICRGRKERMTDAEIIEELAVEIAFYRKTIIWLENQLREAQEQEAEHLKPQGTE